MIHLILMAMMLLAPAPAENYDALFKKHGAENGVDWRLLKVLATVESHQNPRAENPDGLSAGIMQIHCRNDGKGGCSNKFYIQDWPPKSRQQLYDADYNIHLGAQIVAWNIKIYGLHKGVSIYNSWSARHTPAGKAFPNQFYVDKVLVAYAKEKAR